MQVEETFLLADTYPWTYNKLLINAFVDTDSAVLLYKDQLRQTHFQPFFLHPRGDFRKRSWSSSRHGPFNVGSIMYYGLRRCSRNTCMGPVLQHLVFSFPQSSDGMDCPGQSPTGEACQKPLTLVNCSLF